MNDIGMVDAISQLEDAKDIAKAFLIGAGGLFAIVSVCVFVIFIKPILETAC